MNVYREVPVNDYRLFVESRIVDTKVATAIEFLYKGKRHRTDGPALITYYNNQQGSSTFYYIHGELVKKDEFIKVMNAPLRILPLYINNHLLKEIAKDRLAGTRSKIILTKSQGDESDIRRRSALLDEKQLMVMELINTINQSVYKNIQHLKPFMN